MKKNKKGFTLVELVIVVAVMAVLIAVAIPTVTSITRTAKETVAKTNAQTIESTLKLKEADMNKNGEVDQILEGQDIFDAIYDAKLGIDGGTFVFNRTTGVVYAIIEGAEDNHVTAAKEYTITFSQGALEVTCKDGTAAEGDTPAVPDSKWTTRSANN